MDKKDLINLTNKIYKITLLFPKKDPLRYKIREKANDLLADYVSLKKLYSPNPGLYLSKESDWREIFFSLEKDLDIIDSYFEISKWQNWVNYFEILELQEEYDKIRGGVKEEIGKLNKDNRKGAELEKIEVEKPTEGKLDSRKEKIITILKKTNRIQVGEINEVMPDVSKRTLRRDFQKLVDRGFVERIGDNNNTFYRLKIKET